MAIDPNILLQRTVPDVGSALLRGLQGVQAIQSMQQAAAEAPLRQQILETQAEALRDANLASKVKALISPTKEGKFEVSPENINTAKRLINESSLSEQDKEFYGLYIDAGRWQQLNNISDQAIQRARDIGVYERDYGAVAGAAGYTPSAVQLFEYRQKLIQQGDEKALEEFDNIIKTSQIVPGGGETRYAYNPITGKTELIDVSGTGTGRQQRRDAVTPDKLGPPPPPKGVSITQEEMRQPIDLSTTPEETRQPTGDSASEIRRRERELAAAKKTGELDAKEIADLRNQVNTTRSNIARFEGRFKKQGIDILQTLKDAPQTGVSGVFSRYASFFVNGLSSERAQAKLEPLFQDLVRIQPFPPGAQSQPELEARQKAVGDILSNGRLTPEDKLEMITDYFDGINAEAKEKWAILNETREENGLPRVATPYDEGKPFGAPKASGATTLGPTATERGQGVPTGVDPADWAVMTPEERALWQ